MIIIVIIPVTSDYWSVIDPFTALYSTIHQCNAINSPQQTPRTRDNNHRWSCLDVLCITAHFEEADRTSSTHSLQLFVIHCSPRADGIGHGS